jgi:hypothetical protein
LELKNAFSTFASQASDYILYVEIFFQLTQERCKTFCGIACSIDIFYLKNAIFLNVGAKSYFASYFCAHGVMRAIAKT